MNINYNNFPFSPTGKNPSETETFKNGASIAEKNIFFQSFFIFCFVSREIPPLTFL